MRSPLRKELLPPRRIVAIFGAALLTFSHAGRADYADDIGLNKLRTELGAAIPTGSGITVSQIEASASSTSLIYMPDTASSEFTGKTITPKSGASTISGHATSVAGFYFGRFSSLAPNVSVIDVYDANSWIGSNYLNYGVRGPQNRGVAPLVESRMVQNHSWIGTVDNGGVVDIELLRRFDFAIQRDHFLAAVGLNNGVANSVPALLGNSFNAISVGLTNGNHSTGVSSVDGSGRVKPEIVAPGDATSYSTPLVSSAGAMLMQAAPTAARNSVTLKAIMLAGATKDQFAGWARTSSRPLDSHFGAGQLNIFQSYQILNSGQQPANSGAVVAKRGWDNNTTATDGRLYFFDVTEADSGSRIAALLTWNRIVTDGALPGWGDLSVSLGNLELRLYSATGFTKGALIDESVSPIDNVEHIYKSALSPGRYALEVTGNQTGVSYSLAWTTVANVAVVASAPIASERGLVPGTFTFIRTGDLSSAVTVPFFVKGSAANGVDYQPLPTTVTIPANQASATLTVSPLSDTLAEGDETVTVTLASGLAPTFADANATVTIQDESIEGWRALHFTAAELNDSSISGDLADYDHDGLATVVEYALGLDPKAPDANALPSTVVNSSGIPELTFTKGSGVLDITYTVEVSTDLIHWNPAPTVATAQGVSATPTSDTAVVSSGVSITAEPVQYMRLRVSRQ